MKIGITNDHRGLKSKIVLEKFLTNIGHEVVDYGTKTDDPVDFPDYALKLGKGIVNGDVQMGIAICGTGIGMSIALNKVKGVYCAKVCNVSEALLCRSHNDANVIALSEDIEDNLLKEIVVSFINTPFSNVNKYINRNNKIRDIENG
mgnify:CR=1 FL=1